MFFFLGEAKADGSCSERDEPRSGFANCQEMLDWRAHYAQPEKTAGDSVSYQLMRLREERARHIELKNGSNCVERRVYEDTMLLHINGQIRILESEWESLSPAEMRVDYMNAFSVLAQDFANEVEEKRQADLGTMMAWYETKRMTRGRNGRFPMFVGIEDLDHAVETMAQDVDASLRTMETHYATRVSNDSEAESNFRSLITENVSGNMRNYWSGDDVRGGNMRALLSNVGAMVEQYPSLAGKPPNLIRYEFLTLRARERETGQTFVNSLTPYHARMLLLYHLKGQFLVDREADELAANLRLRTNLADLGPAYGDNDENAAIAPQAPSWRNSIFHDGYFYGAKTWMNDNLFNSESGSCGTDCSLSALNVAQTMGFLTGEIEEGKRWTTGDMTSHCSEYREFECFQVCSERELLPGDIVVQSSPGHAFVFTGYDPSAQQAFKVVDGFGTSKRNLRHAALDLYPPELRDADSNCRDSRWTIGDSAFTVLRPKVSWLRETFR